MARAGNKMERVLAALAGEKVSPVPFSVWCHLGTQHLPGQRAAGIQLDFFRFYDLDWLKVMNDYRYPLPEGVDAVRSVDDLRRFRPLGTEAPHVREQLALLAALRAELEGDAFFIDTVFSPFGTVLRCVKGATYRLMREYPEEFLRVLQVVTADLKDYVAAALRSGAAGIFFSVNGAVAPSAPGGSAAPGEPSCLSREEFLRFVRPFDLQVLEVAMAAGRFNVVHVHGAPLAFDWVADYPGHAFNWSTHHTPPSLAEGRGRTGGRCVIGGIDEVQTPRYTVPEIREQVRQAIGETGGVGMMVGPGCAIPVETPPDLILAARQAAREWRG